jgi:hypothetical protein
MIDIGYLFQGGAENHSKPWVMLPKNKSASLVFISAPSTFQIPTATAHTSIALAVT